MKKLLSTLTALALAAGSSQATLLVEETFNYAAGTRIASDFTIPATGTGFTGNIASSRGNGDGTNSAQVDITAGSLSYGSLQTSNNKALMDYNGFGANQEVQFTPSTSLDTALSGTGASYWASFLFSTPSDFRLNEGLAIVANRGNFADYWGFRAIGTSNTTAEWSLGIGSSFSSGVALAANTTYLAVLKIERDAATANWTTSAWVDSSGSIAGSEGALGAADTTFGTTAGSTNVIDKIKFLAYNDHPGSGSESPIDFPMTLDEFRIGTDYLDVVPVPEPTTLALLAGGLTALMAFRRRRA